MIHSPSNWIEAVRNGKTAIQSLNILTQSEIITEILIMGLRLSDGISLEKLRIAVGEDALKLGLNWTKVEKYQDMGFMSFSKDSIALTHKGIALHNYLVKEICM
jgi:oxygen-independent coproporphyrinogen-3 oxidase